MLSFNVVLNDFPVGSGFCDDQLLEPVGYILHEFFADGVLRGKMARVDEVDALAFGIEELVIAQVRRDEGVAPGADGVVLEVAAGAAAHRHTADGLSSAGIADAVAAERPGDEPDEVRQVHGLLQPAHPAQAVVAQGPRVDQFQLFRQNVVDPSPRDIQIRMHTDGGNAIAQQLQQQMALGRIAPDALHRQPAAVHDGVVGHDQLTAVGKGLVRHVLRDVQRH